MALSRMEPFGEEAADLRHGISASVLANLHRDPKKRPEPYKATDFIYWHAANRDADKPIQLNDVEAQSNLIKQALMRAQDVPR